MTGVGSPGPTGPGGRIDAVLFDLDGTLTDSQSGIVASYRHTLGRFGLAATDDEIRTRIGPPLPLSLEGLGVPADRIDDAVVTYRRYFAAHGIFDNHLYPGVAAMLDRLSAAGLVMAVATSKLTQYAVEIVGHFGIAAHFAAVVGATRDGARMHKDDIVAQALLELGAHPERTLMVGDREHDIAGAAANGVDAIAVLWGYGSRAELTAAGAHRFAEDPAALAVMILGCPPPAGRAAGAEAPG